MVKRWLQHFLKLLIETNKMEDFSDIRAFYDDDVKGAVEELVKEPIFIRLINAAFPGANFEDLLKQVNSAEDVQRKFIVRYLDRILKESADELTFSGLENLKKGQAHFIISNHRDIILDSALLNYILLKNGLNSTEIAIGDNLLIFPWIKTLVRLNKSFIVKRNLPIKQMMVESQRLSKYIRHTLLEKGSSVWIAQREGRAKDANDRTSNALLKMLTMGGEFPFSECLATMNVTPLSIAYEYDPCDYLKAREFLLKRNNPDFVKSPTDDLLNMRTGIEGYKGRIHFHIAPTLSEEIVKLESINKKNEQVVAAAELIDQQIHLNYKFYPCNFVAHDMLHKNEEFTSYYNSNDKERFETYLQKQIDRIPEKNSDEAFLRESLLTMYSNPLINHIVAHNE